jgi:tRNA C32,U32 (ribose-2'-O)-methylase TrmJ
LTSFFARRGIKQGKKRQDESRKFQRAIKRKAMEKNELERSQEIYNEIVTRMKAWMAANCHVA